MSNIEPPFEFDNSFARQMEGFYVAWQGEKAPLPEIIVFNAQLALEMSLDANHLETPEGAALLTGGMAPEGSDPLSQVYAGHQFGGFSEQLGDGRALLLGEIVDTSGLRRDVQLKGSGRTPFSRNGDGKAALGPVLREYLLGEAMHALGIRTTRALAAATTGEQIARDGLQPGAVLTRVAASHLRVGTFQFFAARGEMDKVKVLADYAINRHYPQLNASKTKYLDFLSAVIEEQAALVASWMAIGFVHGVMNTDNVTISGETIDYGPCAFIDTYALDAVFSSIDRNGRYAFGNQAQITQWNLARFAETLLPLFDDDDESALVLATNAVNSFPAIYTEQWLTRIRRKIGLENEESSDAELITAMFSAMEEQHVDFTLFFRYLAESLVSDSNSLLALFDDSVKISRWLEQWSVRLSRDQSTAEERKAMMDSVNPLYIPRNHNVEEALLAAWKDGDYVPFNTLLDVLENPFTKRAGLEVYETPAPEDFGPYKTFCGT